MDRDDLFFFVPVILSFFLILMGLFNSLQQGVQPDASTSPSAPIGTDYVGM